MNLKFDTKLARAYKSPSQIIRILSESWVKNEGYCPQCGDSLFSYANNNPVGDFYCKRCVEDYELKAKKGNVGKTINDGAYRTMIERLGSENNPSFFFISYDNKDWSVKNFLIIPKHFFTSEIIIKRKALPMHNRRAGWVGCNIDLENIPQSGKIFYVRNGVINSRDNVKNNWQKTIFLRETKSSELKGWILDVMNCLDRIGKKEFKLDEVYKFVDELSELHPGNNHVKDKIRQQLQFLRDKNYLEFVGRGKYKIVI